MPASKPEQRIEEGSPLWNRRAHELALNFCPPIRPCADCGNPYINGYCCTYCGSTNPEGFTNASE